MKEKQIDFGNEKVAVVFRKLFFPTLLGMLSLSAVTTIDGIFVGHGVGSDGIAAVNLCIPLLMLITGIGLMVGAGCSVMASVFLSKGKISYARATVTQAMFFCYIDRHGRQYDDLVVSGANGLLAGNLFAPASDGDRLPGLVCTLFAFSVVGGCSLVCHSVGRLA